MLLQVILEGFGLGHCCLLSVLWASAKGLLGWCIFTARRCSSGA